MSHMQFQVSRSCPHASSMWHPADCTPSISYDTKQKTAQRNVFY